jgi:hypothetical protein
MVLPQPGVSTPWRLLNHRQSDIDLPPLLISTTFTSNSYTINLTDLTYIWCESLDRRGIIKRSLDEDTTIDPSEDAEQMRVFLEKIESGLSHGDKTFLSLRAFPPKDKHKSNGLPDLDLVVTAHLPKPLGAFVWPIELKVAPQSALSSQLIIPILRAQNARMRELDMLVGMLRDKDHVIQKLVDKLEETGTELGHVFPGAVGKGGRKIPRKLAEERVKGLGVFEVEEWRKEMRKKEKDDENKDVMAVVKDIFGGDSRFPLAGTMNSGMSTSLDQWWDRILLNDVVLGVRGETAEEQREKYGAALDKGKCLHEAREEMEDDFQVQATPPRNGKDPTKETGSTSSPPTLQSQRVIDDSTEDEDDLDGPSQRSAIPDSYQPPSPKPQQKRLGAIGQSKPTSKAASPPRAKDAGQTTPAKASEDSPMADDDETASEDDREPLPPPKRHKTHPKHAATPPPERPKKGGICKIGGKRKEATPPVTTTSDDATLPQRTPKHKLGVIGHKAAATPEPERSVDEANRGRSATVEEEEKRPRETPKERADRKREELKRELEEKAKMPVRKKRKF